MQPIETAILRTVLYASVFNFPLTAEEIQHFLMYEETTSLEQIKEALATSSRLQRMLKSNGDYYTYTGCSDLFTVRKTHAEASAHLWPLALNYGRWLARLPFVKMVALTGALAMKNASASDDDLDYLLVTAPGRVWLARAFAIVLVRFGRLRGVEICPNYILAESALAQDKQDLFMAHEVAQMVPVYGQELYWQMRAANAWVRDYLPNANSPFYSVQQDEGIGGGWSIVKRLLEAALSTRLGDALERWEYRRKLRRFAQDMQTPHSSAQLDDQQVKGHFNDHGHPVLEKYYKLLHEYEVMETPFSAPGD